jgi:ribosomal protein S18 acetylase RimI-like enzyme
MDDRELFDRQSASLREFCRLVGRAAPQSQVVVTLVATLPEARGRGLAWRLLTRWLHAVQT